MRILTTLILVLLAKIVLAGNPVKTVKICGTVTTPTVPEAELFLLNDPLFLSDKKYLLTLQNGSQFSYDLPLDDAGFAELKYGEAVQQIWLEPGFGLEISFNGLDFKKSLQFQGTGAAANNFLKNFYQAFPDLGQKIEGFMSGATAEDYKKFIFEIAEKRLQFITNDSDFRQSPVDFQVLFSKNENYWTGYQLLRYAFDKPLFEDKWDPLVLPEAYYDFLSRLHVITKGLLQSPDYQAFLDKYIEYLKIKPENNGKIASEIMGKNLSGEALWLFQAREIAKTFNSGKSDEARQMFSNFKKDCTAEILIQPLAKKLEIATIISAGIPAPNFGLTTPDGKMVSLQDLRGKIIYLDFWATWCARCLEEMPKLIDLSQKFPAEKVAFVFISFDKNPAAWREFVQNRALGGLQLWGEPMQNSEVARMYGVSALPTAFLIDAAGNIVKAGSGGFAIEEISNQIQQLLGSGK